MPKVTLLHLTDLHFGVEPSPTGDRASTVLAQRRNTLDRLLTALAELEESWKPQVVVVSGDLGWAGRPADYQRAAEWISRLLESLSLTSTELVLCAGNHDVDRNVAEFFSLPENADRADRLLRVEALSMIGQSFEAYASFHRNLGVPQLQLGPELSVLAGVREVAGLRFVVLNSAWFCRNDADRGNLFLGFPQLEVMEAAGDLPRSDHYDEETVTLGVLHHPKEWLNDAENHAYGDRPAAYNELARRTHLLLSGHTHGGVADPQRISNRALLFVGGAAYDNGRYRNNFSLFRFDTSQRTVQRRAYEFDPRNREWKLVDGDDTYSLRMENVSHSQQGPASYDVAIEVGAVRNRARIHAESYVESKSRAIALTRMLPRMYERRVGIHDPAERIRREYGELAIHTERNRLPFREAVQSERPTFLLGDLGGGKSTLVGQFIAEMNADESMLLGLVVPANSLSGK